MLGTNLKVLFVVLATLAVYTVVANAIPQVESEVPEELTFSGEVSTAELVSAGEDLYQGAGGCTACHGLGTRAPNLLTGEGGMGAIGARCGDRVEGLDCKAYLHESMVDPGAYVVEGYNPIMPDMRRTLSSAQIWAVIAYLQDQGGQVTVTGQDVQSEEPGGGAEATSAGPATAGGGGASPAGDATDPVGIMQTAGCFACHVLGDRGTEVGPPFDGIGSRADPDYIRRSILDPAAEAAAGYEALRGAMPPIFGQLTAAQLEAVVRFLAEQE